MEVNETSKYDYLMVRGSILLLNCRVHFSVPLNKWILLFLMNTPLEMKSASMEILKACLDAILCNVL